MGQVDRTVFPRAPPLPTTGGNGNKANSATHLNYVPPVSTQQLSGAPSRCCGYGYKLKLLIYVKRPRDAADVATWGGPTLASRSLDTAATCARSRTCNCYTPSSWVVLQGIRPGSERGDQASQPTSPRQHHQHRPTLRHSFYLAFAPVDNNLWVKCPASSKSHGRPRTTYRQLHRKGGVSAFLLRLLAPAKNKSCARHTTEWRERRRSNALCCIELLLELFGQQVVGVGSECSASFVPCSWHTTRTASEIAHHVAGRHIMQLLLPGARS